MWDRAEAALKAVCESMNLPDMTIEPGEAAFYGPKADFVVTDCIGREWQLGTVQLDYNLPSKERFGLEYIGADNHPHQPVMIHRAPLGSMERFVGVLIEHFAGAFPLWLAPEQVRVLTVSEKSEPTAAKCKAKLAAAGLRATGDYRGVKLRRKNPRCPGRVDSVHVRRRRKGPRRWHRVGPRPPRRRHWHKCRSTPRSPSSARKSTPKQSARLRKRQPAAVADRESQNEY